MQRFPLQDLALEALKKFTFPHPPMFGMDIDTNLKRAFLLAPSTVATRKEAFEFFAKRILSGGSIHYYEYFPFLTHLYVDMDYESYAVLAQHVGGNVSEWTNRVCASIVRHACSLIQADPPFVPEDVRTLVMDSSDPKHGKFSVHALFKLPRNCVLDGGPMAVGMLMAAVSQRLEADGLVLPPNKKGEVKPPVDLQVYPINAGTCKSLRSIGSTKMTFYADQERYILPVVNGVKKKRRELDIETILDHFVAYVPDDYVLVHLKNSIATCIVSSANGVSQTPRAAPTMTMARSRSAIPPCLFKLAQMLREKRVVRFDKGTGEFIISGSRRDCPFYNFNVVQGTRWSGDEPHARGKHKSNHIVWSGRIGLGGDSFIAETCHNEECRGKSRCTMMDKIRNGAVQDAIQYKFEESEIDLSDWL